MNKFVHRLRSRLYLGARTNGLVADWGYWGTHHFEEMTLKLRYYWRKWVSSRFVPEAEVLKLRFLDSSAMLQTGVASICNAKCVFCAYPKVVAAKTFQPTIMSFEVFKKAIDEWAKAGGKSLDMTWTLGDPLVDPGLLQKVDYAINQAHMEEVGFTTNGILLDRNDTYKKLVDLGINAVFISTPGTNKEVYEKIYGVNKYAEAISGIHHLLEYNHSKGDPVRIVIRYRNAEKPSEILNSPDFIKYVKPYLSGRVLINFTVDYDNWAGTIVKGDMSGVMRMRSLPPQLNLPCQRLFTYAIRHDGSVRLCGCRIKTTDMDDMIVGTIREKSLEEISRSDVVKDIISGFYHGKRPLVCQECTFYTPVNRKWLKSREARHSAMPVS